MTTDVTCGDTVLRTTDVIDVGTLYLGPLA